jgi:putative holliday junction resolvase
MKEADNLGLIANLGISPKEGKHKQRVISGKILGIDYGTKNIGLAVSDREQSQAFVYGTLKMSNKLFDELKEICEKELIDKVVVGLPLSMKGKYTEKTEEAVVFMEELESRTKLLVEIQDERLSSVEADKTGSGHGRDEESARIILQQYLDRKNNEVSNLS